jgi:hypothetical protein
MRTHLLLFGHLRDRLVAGLVANLFTETVRRSPPSSRHLIGFGKAFVAREAPEPTFVQDEFDSVASQGQISLLPFPRIMNLDTFPLTIRANRLCGSCNRFNLNHAGLLADLREEMEFRHVEGNPHSFFRATFFRVMLI